MENKFKIRAITDADSESVKRFMRDYWGGEPLVIRRKKYYPSQGMQGLFAVLDNEIIGLLIYEIREKIVKSLFLKS